MSSGAPSDVVVGRLRRRLTLAFFGLALAGLAGLVVVLLLVSSRYESTRLDDRLTASASRAAALVYVDGQDRVRLEAVRDDSVSDTAFDLVVVAFDGAEDLPTVLLDPGGHGAGVVGEVARSARTDRDDQGSTATVQQGSGSLRVAALPWYDGNQIAGAVVAVTPAPTPTSSPVLPVSLAGGVVLLGLLTMSVWWLVGRGLRPATEAFAERERFLASAAHELRAPLARLRAAAEAARRHAGPGGSTGASDARLRDLVAIADGAGQVVSNLLLATRIERTEVPVAREPVRLDQVLSHLELAYDDLVVDVVEPVTITGDAALVRHAVVNLVENAYRHGRVGDATPTVVATARVEEGGVAVLEVRDDGPGFPPDLDVLAPHVTGGRGGAGLGLSLVGWIAETHGAALQIASGSPGSPGARVLLRFLPPGARAGQAR